MLAHTAQPGKMQQHSVHHTCSTTCSTDAASKQCSHLPGLHSRAVLRPHPVCCPHPAAPLGCQSAADPHWHLLLLQLLLCLPPAAVQAVALQAVQGRVPQAVLLIWERWSPVDRQQVEHRDQRQVTNYTCRVVPDAHSALIRKVEMCQCLTRMTRRQAGTRKQVGHARRVGARQT